MNDLVASRSTDTLNGALRHIRLSGFAVIVVFFGAFFLLGSIVPIPREMRVEGRLISADPAIAVRNGRAGILEEILVRDGDRVLRDQTIARMDVGRLQIEAESARRQLKHLRLEQLHMRRSLGGNSDLELDAALEKELVETGVTPDVLNSILGGVGSGAHAGSKIAQAIRLSALQREIIEQERRLAGIELDVERSEISSPATGAIRNTHYSVGNTAIPALEVLMEIVPEGQEALVEIVYEPSRITGLAPGTRARVTLPASAVEATNNANATVVRVLPEEKGPNAGSRFRRAHLKLDLTSGPDVYGADTGHSIRQHGANVSVRIVSGNTTFLANLLRPIERLIQQSAVR